MTQELESYLSDSALNGNNAEGDLLGHNRLADRVEKAIRSNFTERGFVIGLKGRWGTGKTYLLDCIEHRLKQRSDVAVLRYNPWLMPKADHVQSFFSDIAKVAELQTADNTRKVLARKFRDYSELLIASANVIEKSIKLVLNIFIFITVGMITANSTIVKLPNWLLFIAFVALIVILVIRLSSDVLKALASWMTVRSRRNETLSEFKRNLSKYLRNQKTNFVVLIDDIDRLYPEAICSIFQVVKNNGDLDKVSYVLAFDQTVVQEALKHKFGDQYCSFTDKIVQLEFELPLIHQEVLKPFFEKHLNAILKEQPDSISSFWNATRSENYFFLYYMKFIHTFRDAKRILNTIRLDLPLIFNENIPEVDPVDFISLEIIKVKFPSVYSFVKENKRAFVEVRGPAELMFPDNENNSEYLKSRFDERLETVENDDERKSLKEMLEDLFPRLKTLGQEDHPPSEVIDQEWLSELRVCHFAVFDRALFYGNFPGDISNLEVISILDRIRKRESFNELLKPHYRTDHLRGLISQVAFRLREVALDPEATKIFLTGVYDASDYLTESEYTIIGTSIRFFVPNIVENVIRELPEEKRVQVFQDSLESSHGISGPVFTVCLWDSKDSKKKGYEPVASIPISDDAVRIARETVYTRGISWLSTDDCLRCEHFRYIGRCLKRWSENNEFECALEKLLSKDSNLKLFLCKFTERITTKKLEEAAGTVSYRFDFENLSRWVNLRELHSRIESLSVNGDEREEIGRAVELFKSGICQHLEDQSEQ